MPAIVYNTRYDPAYRHAVGDIPAYPAGTLLTEENGGYYGSVWVVDYTGKLRFFKSAEIFTGLGFKWEDIKKVPEFILEAYGFRSARAITDTDPLVLVGPVTAPVTYVDPVLEPRIEVTSNDQLQSEIDAQKREEEQARLAAAQAAAAEAARIAEQEAARLAAIEQAARYEAQRQAEMLALQAEAARLKALEIAEDPLATAAEVEEAQTDAMVITQEAKSAADYAHFLTEKSIVKTKVDSNVEKYFFMAVIVIGLGVLIYKFKDK